MIGKYLDERTNELVDGYIDQVDRRFNGFNLSPTNNTPSFAQEYYLYLGYLMLQMEQHHGLPSWGLQGTFEVHKWFDVVPIGLPKPLWLHCNNTVTFI